MPITPEQFWNYNAMRLEAQRIDPYDWEYVAVPITGMSDRFIARNRGNYVTLTDTSCGDFSMIAFHSSGVARHIAINDLHLSATQRTAMNTILNLSHLTSEEWTAREFNNQYGTGQHPLITSPWLYGGYRSDGQRVEIRNNRHYALKLDANMRDILLFPPGVGGYEEHMPTYARGGNPLRFRLNSTVMYKGNATRLRNFTPSEFILWFPRIWSLGVSLQQKLSAEIQAHAENTSQPELPTETSQQQMMRMYRNTWANLNRNRLNSEGVEMARTEFVPFEGVPDPEAENEYVVDTDNPIGNAPGASRYMFPGIGLRSQPRTSRIHFSDTSDPVFIEEDLVEF